MGEVIWVEVLTRHRDVAARHRFDGGEVMVGRGYDNDVVVDDPYVSPRHLRIVRAEDGRLVAEDLGSANGLFADRGSKRLERVVLDGNRPIRIGHTYIRVRDADHAVGPERVIRSVRHTWVAALGLAAVIALIEVLHLWLADFGEAKLSRYLLPLLYLSLIVLTWSAAWAVLARVFSGQARYERNLLIALAVMLAWSLFNEIAEYAGFALSWRLLSNYDYVAMWLFLGLACFLHLWVISVTRLRLKAALVGALAAVAIATQAVARNDAEAVFDPLALSRSLKPPVLRLTPLGDSRSFLAGLDRLRHKLEEDRRKKRNIGDADSEGDLDD